MLRNSNSVATRDLLSALSPLSPLSPDLSAAASRSQEAETKPACGMRLHFDETSLVDGHDLSQTSQDSQQALSNHDREDMPHVLSSQEATPGSRQHAEAQEEHEAPAIYGHEPRAVAEFNKNEGTKQLHTNGSAGGATESCDSVHEQERETQGAVDASVNGHSVPLTASGEDAPTSEPQNRPMSPATTTAAHQRAEHVADVEDSGAAHAHEHHKDAQEQEMRPENHNKEKSDDMVAEHSTGAGVSNGKEHREHATEPNSDASSGQHEVLVEASATNRGHQAEYASDEHQNKSSVCEGDKMQVEPHSQDSEAASVPGEGHGNGHTELRDETTTAPAQQSDATSSEELGGDRKRKRDEDAEPEAAVGDKLSKSVTDAASAGSHSDVRLNGSKVSSEPNAEHARAPDLAPTSRDVQDAEEVHIDDELLERSALAAPEAWAGMSKQAIIKKLHRIDRDMKHTERDIETCENEMTHVDGQSTDGGAAKPNAAQTPSKQWTRKLKSANEIYEHNKATIEQVSFFAVVTPILFTLHVLSVALL
jgi:hypothetical protein